MNSDHDHPERRHGEESGRTPPSPAPAPEIAAIEDSSTRALAEALRSSFVIVKVLMLVLVVIFLFSGVFVVEPHERAIIFRLGKPVGTPETMLRGPGLHWAFPYPIDEPERISIGQVQTVRSTVGWHGDGFPGPSLNPAIDGYTLTADGNIIHTRATLRYRIDDPVRYAFNFVNASNIVQNALDSALLFASAHYRVDDAIRRDVRGFQEGVARRVNELVHAYELGITLEAPEVETIAPRQVMEKFNEVHSADQDRDRQMREARGEADTMLSQARSEAQRIINEAESGRARLVGTLAARARYMEDRLSEYERDPDFFRGRLRTDTMSRVLQNPEIRQIWILPDTEPGQTTELRLFLNQPLQRTRPQAGEEGTETR